MPSSPRVRPRYASTLGSPVRAARFFGRRGLALSTVLLGRSDASAQPSASSLGWEAVGASAGSLAGFGLGVLLADGPACGEDLTCILEDVAVAVSAATAGSVVGAPLAGEAAGGSPAWWGALAGSVAGAAAGLGVVKLLDEGGVKNEVAGVVAFSVSQGTFTALGGWLAGR